MISFRQCSYGTAGLVDDCCDLDTRVDRQFIESGRHGLRVQSTMGHQVLKEVQLFAHADPKPSNTI